MVIHTTRLFGLKCEGVYMYSFVATSLISTASSSLKGINKCEQYIYHTFTPWTGSVNTIFQWLIDILAASCEFFFVRIFNY